MHQPKQGIYEIVNTVNSKKYIGQSKDIYHRFFGHKTDLRRGKHNNQHLQRAWNRYGEQCFVFDILEIVNHKEDLTPREQYWMDQLTTEQKYNICPIAGGGTGLKLSEEHKQKIRETQKLNYSNMSEEGKQKRKEHLQTICSIAMMTEETKTKARKARIEYWLGRHHTDEAKKKKSEKSKALWESEEYRKKQKDALIKRKEKKTL